MASPPQDATPTRADVLILGGGRFGRLAAQRLGRRVLALAEVAPTPDLANWGVPIWDMAAVPAALQALASPQPPAWLAPCVPVHFLAHWLLASLAGHGARPLTVPPEAEPRLPLLGRGQEGQLFLSLTDTLCPDDCPEPAQVCPKSGQPRGRPLYQRLRDLRLPGWEVAVLRSHQLAPGVGGLAAAEMLGLRALLAGRGGRWLVATACRCHGVLSGLELPEHGL